MKQSILFSKTRKDAPKDEVSRNAQLLIRGGFIHKEMAGVYSFLPLGLRVLEKINTVIREEMEGIGGQEIHLSALQDKKVWEETDRWSDAQVDVWFKTRLQNDTELGLGFTHEEPLTALMTNHVHSYKDLPVYPYQIQTKFRNEVRSKSGLMRGREFLMKDLYSFSKDDVEHNEFYEKAKVAYMNVFSRIGLGDSTFLTFAAGGSFAPFSHEFQTLTEAGEDTIYISEKAGVAINEEIIDEANLENITPGEEKGDLRVEKSVEVGNIFSLGTKFSEPLGLKYTADDGKNVPVVMGCYGIGPSRLMGVIAELNSDENSIVWPQSVAPFDVHLLSLGNDEKAEVLYKALEEQGIDVLFDDRDIQVGGKFADADLIGVPYRIIVGKKTEGEVFEVLNRETDETSELGVEEIVSLVRG
jgi:prolyl-tRNA synthetase